jgi:hypothetical protein
MRDGYYYGTSTAKSIVRRMIANGTVTTRSEALQSDDRLDIIAQRVYDNASLWWVIAAASNIGWGLQVPAGTYLVIPTNVNVILSAIG